VVLRGDTSMNTFSENGNDFVGRFKLHDGGVLALNPSASTSESTLTCGGALVYIVVVVVREEEEEASGKGAVC